MPPIALAPDPPHASLLERLLEVLHDTGTLRLCFDDLSGITTDYPEFSLPESSLIHDCAHCTLAKSAGAWIAGGRFNDCAVNKRATNSLAMRRKAGFYGLCHLGVLDLVEPLIYHKTVLGVFYYGQVAVRQWQARSLARIRRYSARRNLDPEIFIESFRQLPRIDADEIEGCRRRLRTVAETVGLLCESLAVPVDRYRMNWESISWRFLSKKPALVQAVGDYVSKHYDKPCRVSDLAARFKCHPNYLGALFQSSIGQTLGEFVNSIRVERAKHLLRVGRFGIGEIGYKCGFSDPSHFGKIFRRLEGMSPVDYRRTAGQPAGAAQPGALQRDL